MNRPRWSASNVDLAHAYANLALAAERTSDPQRRAAHLLLGLDVYAEWAARVAAERLARQIKDVA